MVKVAVEVKVVEVEAAAFEAAVDCKGGIVAHQAFFDRKGTSREGVVRPKSRWSNNSGLNIFTTAATGMIMPSYLTALSHVHIGTLTNTFKLNAPLLSPGEG